MFKKEYLLDYIVYGGLAALLYCIPMIYFVHLADYHNTWMLFGGNVLFLFGILTYMLAFAKRKGQNPSTQTMTAAGHLATVFGIVISCIVVLITLAFFSPALNGNVMADAPSQTGNGNTHDLVLFVFMCAIIGNLCGGSFISIIISYASKKNQTKDKKSEVLNN